MPWIHKVAFVDSHKRRVRGFHLVQVPIQHGRVAFGMKNDAAEPAFQIDDFFAGVPVSLPVEFEDKVLFSSARQLLLDIRPDNRQTLFQLALKQIPESTDFVPSLHEFYPAGDKDDDDIFVRLLDFPCQANAVPSRSFRLITSNSSSYLAVPKSFRPELMDTGLHRLIPIALSQKAILYEQPCA